MKWLLAAMAVAMVTALSGGVRAADESALKVGAASVKITPSLTRPVWIAGYENNRPAQSVHDDLYARAVVVDNGKTRMAVVACDLIGMSNYRIRRIREKITSVPPENVLICCTHVHSGPDTLGLWGPNFAVSGIDPVYMETLEKNIIAAVDQAAAAAKPATLYAGKTTVPDGLVHNSREPLQDKELTTLRFAGEDGKTITTLIHYGSHPEVNKSKALTSDFIHYTREEVEAKTGGIAVYLNGALGGMVTPDITAHNIEEMERVGRGVGKAAVAALAGEKKEIVDRLQVQRRSLKLPLANQIFQALAKGKILDADPADTTTLGTEVWRVDIGPSCWMTIPGEVLPKPALALKATMPGAYPMVVALANDEIGYILDPADFDKPLYKYEKSMSVGGETWPKLNAAAQELLGATK